MKKGSGLPVPQLRDETAGAWTPDEFRRQSQDCEFGKEI